MDINRRWNVFSSNKMFRKDETRLNGGWEMIFNIWKSLAIFTTVEFLILGALLAYNNYPLYQILFATGVGIAGTIFLGLEDEK